MGYLTIFTLLASTFIIQKTTVVLGPAKVMVYFSRFTRRYYCQYKIEK
ncbi:hypothetical protein Ping_2079 [Psychromonas ingrahamii 37]|uniref:Uncharacterized protein n=1 Tax=Psychromonas ingrahamii (strain DSM 17664 / CCUG 51855 / 37) TaxID=357804 RepID=A1SWG5_PSYIN|nr:hypothetical protein Ping_2079 [Psychromonas ingrahamii 37]